MIKKHLGNSDLKICPIVFGAWAIGGSGWGGNAEKDSLEAIETAIDAGLSSFDTAPIYGYGRSEELLGRIISKKRNRAHLEIFTKCGLNWNIEKGEFYFKGNFNNKDYSVYKYNGKDGIIKECEDSLKRLSTDYIDLYQIHRPENITADEEVMEALGRLQEQGKIRYAGVSNYDLKKLKNSNKHLSLVSNQMPYSMLERGIEKEMMPFYIENGIGILAYSPLQRGVLSGKYKGEIEWNDDDHRKDTIWFQNENLRIINAFLDRISDIAKGKGASLSQIVLQWTLNQKGISAVLAGARNATQILENINSLDFHLDQNEIELINIELNKVSLTEH